MFGPNTNKNASSFIDLDHNSATDIFDIWCYD